MRHRGLPGGYLAALEQRLVDTEVALIEALSTLRAYSIVPEGEASPLAEKLAARYAKQLKPARLDEWRQLPLHNTWQRSEWLSQMNEILDVGSQQTSNPQQPPSLHETQADIEMTQPPRPIPDSVFDMFGSYEDDRMQDRRSEVVNLSFAPASWMQSAESPGTISQQTLHRTESAIDPSFADAAAKDSTLAQEVSERHWQTYF